MKESFNKIVKKIVGKENVIDDEEELQKFSSDYSGIPSIKPEMVVKANEDDEVLKVVLQCNDEGVPIYPSSSKVHYYGGTIPRREGAIVMDLSGLNGIDEIDKLSHWVRIGAGVSWGQLQGDLEKKGYRSVIPLLPHSGRSVVIDWLEREAPTACKFEYNETIASIWVTWGLGESFITGSASVNNFRKEGCFADGVNPQGPGPIDFWRLLQGSQGTLGIVTKAICKIEFIPSVSKTVFFTSDDLSHLIPPLYEMGKRYVGLERFIVNDVTLAAILGDIKLKSSLPGWTIINVLIGLPVGRPDDMVDYQLSYVRKELKDKFPEITISERLEGAPAGTEEKLPEILRKPWPENKVFWKHAAKGNCQELIFTTLLSRTPHFTGLLKNIALEHSYPVEDMGVYIQPLEDMRACQVSFMLPFDDKNEAESKNVRRLYHKALIEVLNEGGYFNRIYDGIGDVVYTLPRVQGYVKQIRRVKRLFDPNNIMSPGKLCF